MTTVYLGIGSNTDKATNIPACLKLLRDKFDIITLSSVYESEAVGINSDNFYNLVACVETDDSLTSIASYIRNLEFDFGRQEGTYRYQSITIDIDILLYDDWVGLFEGVLLPRPEILTNAFVLLPMSEIAAHVIHPVSGKSFTELWAAYNKADQTLWRVDLTL